MSIWYSSYWLFDNLSERINQVPFFMNLTNFWALLAENLNENNIYENIFHQLIISNLKSEKDEDISPKILWNNDKDSDRNFKQYLQNCLDVITCFCAHLSTRLSNWIPGLRPYSVEILVLVHTLNLYNLLVSKLNLLFDQASSQFLSIDIMVRCTIMQFKLCAFR